MKVTGNPKKAKKRAKKLAKLAAPKGECFIMPLIYSNEILQVYMVTVQHLLTLQAVKALAC